MEKAILKTLIYADLFDYPLKIQEIQKWLIGRKVSLREVEKTLGKLVDRLQATGYRGYYFLPKRGEIVSQRSRRKKQSEIYFRKAKLLSQIFKIIPWVKLVGISGGLALGNTSKKDDIDFFIITGKNRVWISRLIILGLLSLIGQRRKRGDSGRKISGKICVNTLLEEDKLVQTHKDIFVAHEILQMRPLWYRGKIYSKYLEDNAWVFKHLPNWIGLQYQISNIKYQKDKSNISKSLNFHFDFLFLIFEMLERIAKKLQLQIMGKPNGAERIEDGALYFHPEDYRPEILSKYRKKLAK